jgi:hypothetical protein
MIPRFKWISEIWSKEQDEKELNQVQIFRLACILLMNSHHILSLKPIYCTPSLSKHIYIYIFYTLGMEYRCGRIYVEICGKSLVLPRYYNWDIVKTRQASHGLPETHQKGHWKIMLYQGGGEKNRHTLRKVEMFKWQEWSRGTKEVLIIGLHMVGKSLNLASGRGKFTLTNLKPPVSSSLIYLPCFI